MSGDREAADPEDPENAELTGNTGNTGDGEGQESVGAFKDSGSFFRDKVAQTLAEQGFSLRSDGTWDDSASAVPKDSSDEGAGEPGTGEPATEASDAGETAPEADGSDEEADDGGQKDRAGAASSESSESSDAPASAESSDEAASSDDTADDTGADDSWDPESTSAFTPVLDDEDGEDGGEDGGEDDGGVAPDAAPLSQELDQEPGEKGREEADEQGGGEDTAAAASADDSWDPESTAAFAPVFDGDDDEAVAGGETGTAETTAAESTSAGSSAAGTSASGTSAADSAAVDGGEDSSAEEPADSVEAPDSPDPTDSTDPTDSADSADSAGASAAAGAAAVGAAAGAAGAGAASASPEDPADLADPSDSAKSARSAKESGEETGKEPGESGAGEPEAEKTAAMGATDAASDGASASGAGQAGSASSSEGGKPVYAVPTPPPAAPPTTPPAPAAGSADEGGEPVTGARNLLRAKVPGKGKAGDGESAAAASGAAGSGGAGGSGGPGGPKRPGKGKGGGKGKRPKKPMWFRVTRALLITAGVFMLLGIGGFAVAYASFEVPTTAKADATDQGTIFYYSDGETKFAERGVDRDPVSYDEIPEHVQEAVISAEDRGFWTEPGVSVSGTVRGAWSTLTGQQVQGGSTITQQMVRNYFEGVSKDQTVSRKVKEMIIALKIDSSADYDKEWVMEQYLNTIYFGRNAYGIQAAAQAYYHKDVGELTPDEAAFLAAAIQQPTRFGTADSDTTPDMEKRWHYVVNGLVSEDIITEAESDGMEFPKPEENKQTDDLSGYKGYMLQQAMSELEGLGYTEDNINRNGYKVVTTFDQGLMDAAVEAVESNVDVDNLPEGVYAGLTAIDPATGEVVAFYGGKDYTQNQYDSAFRGSAQAGSAFKPYVLAAALESGKSLNTVVDGSSGQTFAGSVINNHDGGGGPENLIEATRHSSNTGYVNLAMETGLDKVVDMAHAAGIPNNKITENQAAAPTLALGVSDVSAVDQASGYATFANGGVHIDPHVVREITGPDGENLRDAPEENRAMGEGAAADVTYALQRVVTSGTGRSAQLPDGRPVAGKTGTTDSSVAGWFAGYTPQLSTAVGVYNGNNQPFTLNGTVVYGGNFPASIWRDFMAAAMEGEDPEPFPSPSYGGETENFAPDVPTQTPGDGGGQAPEEPQQPQQPEVPEQPEQPVDPGPTDPGGGEPGGGGGDGGGGETPPDGGGGPDGPGGGDETPPDGGGGGGDGGGGGGEDDPFIP